MDQKVVFDVKESSLDIIIPGVAINGLAFEDKKEADKFVKKYLSGPKYHVEDRVEKPVFSSLQDFEKTLKRRLTSLKKQLKETWRFKSETSRWKFWFWSIIYRI